MFMISHDVSSQQYTKLLLRIFSEERSMDAPWYGTRRQAGHAAVSHPVAEGISPPPPVYVYVRLMYVLCVCASYMYVRRTCLYALLVYTWQ